jgi:putative redox protein
MTRITLEKKAGIFGFDIKDELGHIIQSDGSEENGGLNYGFRPMQLVLAALGSCSAIDMALILKKQKQIINDFKIEVSGEREKNVVPALWKKASVLFIISGDVDPVKAEKAAALSMQKYCSVAETLRRGGTIITWKTIVEPS